MLTGSGQHPIGNPMNLKRIFPALRKKLSCIAALGGLALLALSPVGDAQVLDSKFLPPTEAFRVEATAEGADRLRVDFLVTPGYYRTSRPAKRKKTNSSAFNRCSTKR